MYIARFSYDVQHVHRQQAFTLCNSLPPCPLSVVAVARTCGRWSRYEAESVVTLVMKQNRSSISRAVCHETGERPAP